MPVEKNEDRRICPHCRAEYTGAKECPNCLNRNDSLSEYLSENKEAEGGSRGKGFLIIAALLFGLVFYLNRSFGGLSSGGDSGQLYYQIFLILIISSILASGQLRRKLKYFLAWGGIFLVLMAGYSYRHELSGVKQRIMAELIPSQGISTSENSVSFPVSADGHFHIKAEVNGVPIMFLVDTGASHIVLSPADAVKLGYEIGKLKFDRYYETANGTVRGSSVRLKSLRVGGILLQDIGASVNGANMRGSLLGMTFFKHMESYEVKGDVLTLRWGF